MMTPHHTLARGWGSFVSLFVNNSDLFVRGNSKGKISGFKIQEVLLVSGDGHILTLRTTLESLCPSFLSWKKG